MRMSFEPQYSPALVFLAGWLEKQSKMPRRKKDRYSYVSPNGYLVCEPECARKAPISKVYET